MNHHFWLYFSVSSNFIKQRNKASTFRTTTSFFYEQNNSWELFVILSDDDDCAECEEILEELEQIDGEADMFGIDFVKIASVEAAQKYEVNSIPALVYFR